MKTAAVITLMSTLVVFSALLLGFGLFNEHRQNNETHGTEPDVILRQGAQTGPKAVGFIDRKDSRPCVASHHEAERCESRNVGEFELFSAGIGGAVYGPAYTEGQTYNVEDLLEKGLRLVGASPVHVAFRGDCAERYRSM